MPQAARNQNSVDSVSKHLFFDMIYHYLLPFMAVYIALPFWMFGASFICSLFKFSLAAVAIVNSISFILEFILIWILLLASDLCSLPPRAIEETPKWPVAFCHACIFSTFLLFQLCVPTLVIWIYWFVLNFVVLLLNRLQKYTYALVWSLSLWSAETFPIFR